MILAVAISRDVSRRLTDVIDRLGTSTTEMLAVTSQVAAGAVQTATAISEAATTVDEVRQTSLLSSQKATSVSDSAQTADQVAEAGRRRSPRPWRGSSASIASFLGSWQSIHEYLGVVEERGL